MFGSYGSYSSMKINSGPINIYTTVTSRDESCAFPSWPRRRCLGSDMEKNSAYEPRPSSYLSDEDLYLSDDHASSDSDDGRSSVSSNGSSGPSASSPTLGVVLASPSRHLPAPSEAEMLEMQRQRLNMRKDLTRLMHREKERRTQQAAAAAAAAAASKQRRQAPKKSGSSNISNSGRSSSSTTTSNSRNRSGVVNTSSRKKRGCNAMAPIYEE